MKRFVLLDLDDTVYDFHTAEHIALSKTLQALGLEPREEVLARYSEINAEQWRLLEQGQLTREQVKESRYQLLFDEFGIDVDPVKAARTYEHNLSIGHYFIDGAEEMLETLSHEYELYLVSNGSTDIQMPRIASGNIARYFRGIFISEAIGHNKPSKAYFDAVFTAIPGFEKEKAVIVGDSLSSDIKGGRAAGITTIWFNPSEKLIEKEPFPDHVISKLSELSMLLERL